MATLSPHLQALEGTPSEGGRVDRLLCGLLLTPEPRWASSGPLGQQIGSESGRFAPGPRTGKVTSLLQILRAQPYSEAPSTCLSQGV